MAKVPLPSPIMTWINPQGQPTQAFIQYMTALAAGKMGPFVEAADDAAAAKAGVGIGQFYILPTSSAVQMRKA